MTGRMKPVLESDQRATHGVEAMLDHARGRSRIRTPGGERLSRKLRLPVGDDWIARICRRERDDIEAEVSQRLAPKPLGAWHWSRIDTIYFCSAGIMKGYHALEQHGYTVDVREITTTSKGPAGETATIRREPGPFFRPVIETIGRLHRMKSDALKELGLDQTHEQVVTFLDQPHVEPPNTEENAQEAGTCDQAGEGVSERRRGRATHRRRRGGHGGGCAEAAGGHGGE